MVIAHNLQAMNAQRQFGITTNKLAKSTEKLASGYKVNRAADDAAGLAISEKMRRQMRGLSQASLNAEDGISMVQIADGAMAEIHDMIDRGVELSIKAANGTLSFFDRQAVQDEIDQIIMEIDEIKERTKFNEIYVLKGEQVDTTKQIPAGVESKGGSLPAWVQLGQAKNDGFMTEVYTSQEQFVVDPAVTPNVIKTVSVNHAAASIDFSALNATNVNDLVGKGFNSTCCTCDSYYSIEFVTGTQSSNRASGNNYIYSINIDNVTTASELINRIIVGTNNGYPNGHFTKFAADGTNPGKLYVYDDRSMDSEAVTKTSDWVNGTSVWQNWSNPYYNITARPRGKFGEGVMHEKTATVITGYTEVPQRLALHIGADAENRMPVELAVISSKALGIDTVDVRSIAGADKGMTAFSDAKVIVSKHRSRMGAYQNRLEHTINNLDNVVENTTAAESRIRDTDMAKEMVAYSMSNILSQVGQSMIAQANQSNQGVLGLIA